MTEYLNSYILFVSLVRHLFSQYTYKCIVGTEELEYAVEDSFVLCKVSLQRKGVQKDGKHLVQRHSFRSRKDQTSDGAGRIVDSVGNALVLEEWVKSCQDGRVLTSKITLVCCAWPLSYNCKYLRAKISLSVLNKDTKCESSVASHSFVFVSSCLQEQLQQLLGVGCNCRLDASDALTKAASCHGSLVGRLCGFLQKNRCKVSLKNH